MTSKPILHNIRILDFSWVLAGPYATRLLADFGAEVIKVQPLLSSEDDDAFSKGYYNTWNRNKLGITLNLNKPEGVALAKRLAGVCDAMVENFAPRVMANWGLDYANLKKVKPDIIMVSMSVMGQASPQRDYVGYGPTVQAFSGMTHLTSFPGKPPIGPGFSYADHVAGLQASIALLGALEERRRTGKGQHIDISEVAAMASLLGGAIPNFKGKELKPAGNSSLVAAPHDVYPCKGENRWCAIAVFTPEEWRGLKRALGNPARADDNKLDTLSGRLNHKDELDGLITAWTREHTAEEVMSLLQENGVAAGVVQDAADIAKDPQLRARGFFIEDTKIVLTDATPIRMSQSPAEYKWGAPSPGHDNDYVYGKLLGMSRDEMAELREKGVI
jgi:crotonobetainyl-CoA:carnitine CoA-transferase CaiB-like acyl-CoA transferase